MNVIAFTKVTSPYGWMGNMSPHPIKYNGKTWRTAEALFQALRFDDPVIIEMLHAQKSPMAVKMKTKPLIGQMLFARGSDTDVNNMRMILKLKLQQHPHLVKELIASKDAVIIEDVSKRHPSIWGAQLINGEWIGDNLLGKLWMVQLCQLPLAAQQMQR